MTITVLDIVNQLNVVVVVLTSFSHLCIKSNFFPYKYRIKKF